MPEQPPEQLHTTPLAQLHPCKVNHQPDTEDEKDIPLNAPSVCHVEPTPDVMAESSVSTHVDSNGLRHDKQQYPCLPDWFKIVHCHCLELDAPEGAGGENTMNRD